MADSSSAVALVVGAGGLLGSAMCAELAIQGVEFQAARGLAWSEPEKLAKQFDHLVAGMVTQADDRPWLVFWCAGVGHVSAGDAVHRSDQLALELLLRSIRTLSPKSVGALVLASSAGAVYSGNQVWPATEGTEPAPLHGYGESKLMQEAIVRRELADAPQIRAVFLRISNLYGVGQAIGKPQGLLSHLVANTFRRVPSTIYVPLDTSRDYLFTSDAAAMAIRAAYHGIEGDPGTFEIRILASEQNYTISQILGILSKVIRRRVPIVARPTTNTGRQPLMLSFRSTDLEQRSLAKVSMEEGISRLVGEYAHARPSVR